MPRGSCSPSGQVLRAQCPSGITSLPSPVSPKRQLRGRMGQWKAGLKTFIRELSKKWQVAKRKANGTWPTVTELSPRAASQLTQQQGLCSPRGTTLATAAGERWRETQDIPLGQDGTPGRERAPAPGITREAGVWRSRRRRTSRAVRVPGTRAREQRGWEASTNSLYLKGQPEIWFYFFFFLLKKQSSKHKPWELSDPRSIFPRTDKEPWFCRQQWLLVTSTIQRDWGLQILHKPSVLHLPQEAHCPIQQHG